MMSLHKIIFPGWDPVTPVTPAHQRVVYTWIPWRVNHTQTLIQPHSFKSHWSHLLIKGSDYIVLTTAHPFYRMWSICGGRRTMWTSAFVIGLTLCSSGGAHPTLLLQLQWHLLIWPLLCPLNPTLLFSHFNSSSSCLRPLPSLALWSTICIALFVWEHVERKSHSVCTNMSSVSLVWLFVWLHKIVHTRVCATFPSPPSDCGHTLIFPQCQSLRKGRGALWFHCYLSNDFRAQSMQVFG